MPGLLPLFIDYTLPSACTTAVTSGECFLTYVPYCLLGAVTHLHQEQTVSKQLRKRPQPCKINLQLSSLIILHFSPTAFPYKL
jgi:hypothetical protein